VYCLQVYLCHSIFPDKNIVYEGYEVAKDFDPFKTDLTQKLQKVRTVLAILLYEHVTHVVFDLFEAYFNLSALTLLVRRSSSM